MVDVRFELTTNDPFHPADDTMCKATMGVIPVSLLRIAHDARSRCHSLVWLGRDRDIALFFSCTKKNEPWARCLAVKPLVSHLRLRGNTIRSQLQVSR